MGGRRPGLPHRWTRQHVAAASGLVYGNRGLIDVGKNRGHLEKATPPWTRSGSVRTAVVAPGLPGDDGLRAHPGSVAPQGQRGSQKRPGHRPEDWVAARSSRRCRSTPSFSGGNSSSQTRTSSTTSPTRPPSRRSGNWPRIWTTTKPGPGRAPPRSRSRWSRPSHARTGLPSRISPSSSGTSTWRTCDAAPRRSANTSP